MKKLALILGMCLISFNLFAFEHVIGISGGLVSSKSDVNHSLTAEYDNICFYEPTNTICQPSFPEQVVNTTDPRIQNTFRNISDNIHRNNGYNFNLEYQARTTLFDIPNFLTLGLGLETSKTNIKPNYLDLNSINYKINTPYVLAMLTIYQNKSFAFRGGLTGGQDFIKADSNTYKNAAFNMLIDCEYIISNHLMLFGRGATQLNKGKDIVYNARSDQTVGNGVNNGNPVILDNKIAVSPQESLLKLNFGVRYKI
ncbi:MAG: hypothetical protein FWE18_04430 [Alphaproteobacteria bacterium]|nr:hypothetical protein [Alphaproteobacteria bacterium]